MEPARGSSHLGIPCRKHLTCLPAAKIAVCQVICTYVPPYPSFIILLYFFLGGGEAFKPAAFLFSQTLSSNMVTKPILERLT